MTVLEFDTELQGGSGMDTFDATAVAIVAETEMRRADLPYWYADEKEPTRLQRAVTWVSEGKVQALEGGFYEVRSSDPKHAPYTLKDTHCACKHATTGKSRFCYHAVSVRLFQLVQAKQAPMVQPPLALPPVTADERLRQESDVLPYTLHPSPLLAHPDHSTPEEDPDTQRAAHTQETAMATTTTSADVDIPEPTRPRANGPAVPQPLTLTLPRRSIQAIVADLSTPLPPGCLASKEQGGQKILFLHWQTVARLLDTYAPGWYGTVTRVDQVGNACAITYRLTIPCAEGDIWREATGQEEEEVKGYGDSTSNAEAMAFKRAAAKFGLGQWLYDKDATAAALTSHLRAERVVLFEALGTALDAHQMPRGPVIDWLRQATGAAKNQGIPVSALRSLLTQLAGEVVEKEVL